MFTSQTGIFVADSEELTKQHFRQSVWKYMTDNYIARYPLPVNNRIPNFQGCGQCGNKLAQLPTFTSSRTIKVNPDKPQEEVRFWTLALSKKLLVPSPRLISGLFNLLENESTDDASSLRKKAQAEGVKLMSVPISLNDKIKVDLIVIGSVAVSKTGYRIGKGEGFADLEYAMMKTMKAIDDNVLIVTTVHDCQVFDDLPMKLFTEYDVPVDIIVTPTAIIQTEHSLNKPKGIYWHLLSKEKFKQIPVLRKLYHMEKEKNVDVTLKDGYCPSEGEDDESQQEAEVSSERDTRSENRQEMSSTRGRYYDNRQDMSSTRGRYHDNRQEMSSTRGRYHDNRQEMSSTRGRYHDNRHEMSSTRGRFHDNRHETNSTRGRYHDNRQERSSTRGSYHDNRQGRNSPRESYENRQQEMDAGWRNTHSDSRRGQDRFMRKRGGRPFDHQSDQQQHSYTENFNRVYTRSPFRGRGRWQDRGRGWNRPSDREATDQENEDTPNIQVTINVDKKNHIVRREVEKTNQLDRVGDADQEETEAGASSSTLNKDFSIYVGGIPKNCRFSDLKVELQNRNVKPNYIAWKMNGYAFLNFYKSNITADDVIESLKGLSLQERELKLDVAPISKYESNQKSEQQQQQQQHSYKSHREERRRQEASREDWNGNSDNIDSEDLTSACSLKRKPQKHMSTNRPKKETSEHDNDEHQTESAQNEQTDQSSPEVFAAENEVQNEQVTECETPNDVKRNEFEEVEGWGTYDDSVEPAW